MRTLNKLLFCLVAVSLFMSSPSIKAQSSQDEIINLFNQSQDYLSKGNYEKAIELKKQLYNKTKGSELAIIGGHCAYDLAQIYSLMYKDLNNYIYWLQRAEECDFPGASGLLGDAYLTGQYGVSQDFQKAKYYYEKSDEGRCLWILATMYSPNGEFGRNDSEWLKYASRAVEKGDPDAQFMLGLCYYYGNYNDNIKKDINKGVELLKKAAQQNHIKAIRFLEEQNIR